MLYKISNVQFANKSLSWSPFSTAVYCTGSGVEHKLGQSNFSDVFLSLLLVTWRRMALFEGHILTYLCRARALMCVLDGL